MEEEEFPGLLESGSEGGSQARRVRGKQFLGYREGHRVCLGKERVGVKQEKQQLSSHLSQRVGTLLHLASLDHHEGVEPDAHYGCEKQEAEVGEDGEQGAGRQGQEASQRQAEQGGRLGKDLCKICQRGTLFDKLVFDNPIMYTTLTIPA